MTALKDVPDRIQWHEGMMLGPQQFQQATLRQDMLLHYHVHNAAPHAWGVTRLEVDPAQLVQGVFSVNALEAVMPDGLAVSYPDGAVGDLKIDLRPFADASRTQQLLVYLTVPTHSGRAAVPGEMARYASVEGGAVTDENTGDNELPLPRLKPRLGLAADSRPGVLFASLPIAAFSHRDDAFRLTEYMPPTPVVAPTSRLAQLGQALSARLREKASSLAVRLGSTAGVLHPTVKAELRHAVQLMTANLPPFEALVASGVAAPFQLYVALAALVGPLAGLGPGLLPPLVGRYDHEDMGACFDALFSFAHRMADTVSETHQQVTFRRDQAAFVLALEPEWLAGGDLLIGLRLRQGLAEHDAAAWMDSALIASAEHIRGLQDKRTRGAARRRLTPEEEGALMPASGTLLYRVAADPHLVHARQPLVVVNPADRTGDKRPADLVLYAPVGDAVEL